VLIAVPAVFVGCACTCLLTRKQGWRALITGCFIAGALASGYVAWQLVPSEWTLPFLTTLEAAVNADKYGHAVEHYAENVVVMITFAAMLGGAACAGAAALVIRIRGRLAHA
jgi:hypothetical protein